MFTFSEAINELDKIKEADSSTQNITEAINVDGKDYEVLGVIVKQGDLYSVLYDFSAADTEQISRMDCGGSVAAETLDEILTEIKENY